MKKPGLLFILLITSYLCFADKGESSRILVHTLNYLSQDYGGAVKNGKIISQSEFKEQLEFGEECIKYFHECEVDWPDSDTAAIKVMIYRLDSLIEKHALFDTVSLLAIETRDKVIAASGLKITPSVYPNLESGRITFKTECAKCHGDRGYGDGPEGKGLNPQPKNFHDDEKIRPFSPFFVFNTVRLGVEGTGMKAHLIMEDDEIWSVAFYALSLRYQRFQNNPRLKSDEIRGIVDSIPLDKIATTSDEDFLKLLKITDTPKAKLVLAAIRLNQPPHGNNNSTFINASLKYLDGAMELYNEGKYNEASELATLSYLEGIEPLEMQLKSNDPQLMSLLEERMHRLTKLMEERKPAAEIKDSVDAAKKSIYEANELLSKKDYSFMLALLMAVSILLREGLEAFLVIMVILSILRATEFKSGTIWVHAGWITAILAGVVIWMLSGRLISAQTEHMELVEGLISLFAVGMLIYVGFWLHGKSEITKWKDYVGKMMKGVLSRESMWGLASLSFFVVFREVFESVLFLSALNIQAAGKQSNAIVFGVLIAFAIIILFAFIVIRFSAKLPIPKLFKISSFVMGVLAVVLAGKGIHSLQETGHISIHGLPLMRVELVGLFPTIETCVAQLVVLVAVVVIWNIEGAAEKRK